MPALQTTAGGLELRALRARLDLSLTPLTSLRVHEYKIIHRQSYRRIIIQICCLELQSPKEAGCNAIAKVAATLGAPRYLRK